MTYPRRRVLTPLLLAAAAVLTASPDAVHAQRLTPESIRDGEVPPQGREIPYDTLLNRLTADALAQSLVRRLRDLQDPSPADYRIIASGYRIAGSMVPDDESFVRRELEAWTAANDDEGIDHALARLVRLAPDDTVAQLRLINRRINRFQDADSRLGAYEVILSPRGDSIDPSIRSRIALDAALMARESGNEAGFVQWLQMASALDVTNKDAAVLFATYIADQSDDPLERLEVMLNVILADPLDREAYLNVAFEMMREGAFEGALRCFDLATTLTLAGGDVLDTSMLFDILLTTWNVDGYEKCIEMTDDLLANEQRREDTRRAQILADGLDPGPERQLRLPNNIETLVLAIHTFNGDTERQTETIDRIIGGLDERLAQINDPEQWPDGLTQALADAAKYETLLEMTWIYAASGVQLDRAEELIEQLRTEAENVDPNALQRFLGWIEGQRGNIESAREMLTPLINRDSAARLGLAISEQKAGNERDALRHFAKIAREEPQTIIGTYARYSVEAIIDKRVRPSSQSEQLDAYIARFAPWLEEAVLGPQNLVSIRMEHVNPEIDLLGRPEMRVKVRNVSGRTLAVGRNMPVDWRLLMTPRLRVGGYDYVGLTTPEYRRLDRRLRLNAGEELDMVVWTVPGPIGAILTTTPELDASLHWRLIQGFEFDANSNYTSGPYSVTTESDIQYRRARRDVGDTDDLIERIGTATSYDFVELVMIVAGRMIDPPDDAGANDPERFVEAIVARMDDLDPRERTLATLILGSTDEFDGPLGEPVIDAVRNRDTGHTRLAATLTGISLLGPAYLPALLEHPDEDVQRFGDAVARKLGRGR